MTAIPGKKKLIKQILKEDFAPEQLLMVVTGSETGSKSVISRRYEPKGPTMLLQVENCQDMRSYTVYASVAFAAGRRCSTATPRNSSIKLFATPSHNKPSRRAYNFGNYASDLENTAGRSEPGAGCSF